MDWFLRARVLAWLIRRIRDDQTLRSIRFTLHLFVKCRLFLRRFESPNDFYDTNELERSSYICIFLSLFLSFVDIVCWTWKFLTVQQISIRSPTGMKRTGNPKTRWNEELNQATSNIWINLYDNLCRCRVPLGNLTRPSTCIQSRRKFIEEDSILRMQNSSEKMNKPSPF